MPHNTYKVTTDISTIKMFFKKTHLIKFSWTIAKRHHNLYITIIDTKIFDFLHPTTNLKSSTVSELSHLLFKSQNNYQVY